MDIRSVWHQTECGKEMNISIVTVDLMELYISVIQ